jgi:hypothetical protein
MKSHKGFAGTEVNNMKVSFKPKKILYADGRLDEF